MPDTITPPESHPRGKVANPHQTDSLDRWQERLRPFVTRVIGGMAIFFFLATMAQLVYLNWSYSQIPPIDISSPNRVVPTVETITFDQQVAARKLEILARMEAYLVERRYHQAAMSTMTFLWIRYLGFITGMMLAFVGAAFVLARLQEPISEVEAKSSGVAVSLRSTSPGLILVLLGAILMYATIVNKDTVETFENRVYLTDTLPLPTPAIQSAPTLMPLETATSVTPLSSSR